MYALLWLLLVWRAALGRLSRAVCAYFYPRREKQRALRLYNDALKRRWGMARFMRARVRVLARQGGLAHSHGLLPALTILLARRWPALHAALTVTRTSNRTISQ